MDWKLLHLRLIRLRFGCNRGAMAAATDTLGRVMLLDVATLAVICLWKVGSLSMPNPQACLDMDT